MDTFGDRLRSVISVAMERSDDAEYQQRAKALKISWDQFERRSQELERKAAYEGWGIPPDKAALLSAPENTEALRAVGEFLRSPALFLMLVGDLGVGKTIAAWWGVAQRGGRYVTAMELVRAGSFDRDFWESLRTAPFVAIDELGMEAVDQSGWFLANLYDLLDHRLSRSRKTALLSNLDAAAFKARYCSGTMERLYERLKTQGEFVALAGESLRVHW